MIEQIKFMKPFVIGICGGSGSGKTTLLKKISSHFGSDNVSVFTMDNYYHPIEQQQKDKNGIVNFDLPTALDEEKLSNDLSNLVLLGIHNRGVPIAGRLRKLIQDFTDIKFS